MTTDIVASRLSRAAASPIVLRGAYRLLFLGGASWALVVVALWVSSLIGAITLPTAMDPLAWHQHEMLFGYLGAIIAGFLSAAIPNWTGRPAYAGWPVAAFVGLWLAARLAILFSEAVPLLLAGILDVGFLLLLALLAGKEVAAAKNRNLPIVFVILLFALASALHYAEALFLPVPQGLGIRLGFALVLILIALIGGRIIPAFTRNWLAREGMAGRFPREAGRFDQIALAAIAIALIGWTFWPNDALVAWSLVISGLLHAVRLARWSGIFTTRDPLVLILHVGYLWLPLGLLLLGASIIGEVVPGTAALHALAAGTMATMTLAVMTRASLGHTGRPLKADRWTNLLYILVTTGAVLRVAGSFLPFDYLLLIRLAGIAWGGAFLLFIFGYGPKLLGPRPDGNL